MKYRRRVLLAFLGMACCVTHAASAPKLISLWTTPGLAIPESVLFYDDGKQPYLFVAQIDGDAKVKDGKGAIATLSTKGKILNLNWVKGLNAPKGMGVYNQKLYVADIDELVEIDIKRGEISQKIVFPGAQFLNDVAVDVNGVVYVTDTFANRIYRMENNTPEILAENIPNANGIKVVGQDLIVGSGREVLRIDKQKQSHLFAHGLSPNVDGIEPIGQGDYLVSIWQGQIYYVFSNGQYKVLLDTSARKINSADIGFDPDAKILYVPTFLNNSVAAYQVQ